MWIAVSSPVNLLVTLGFLTPLVVFSGFTDIFVVPKWAFLIGGLVCFFTSLLFAAKFERQLLPRFCLAVQISALLVLSGSLLQLLGFVSMDSNGHPSSTFGNANMLAEFLLIAVLCGFYLAEEAINTSLRLWHLFFISLCAALVVFLQSRSALLGFGLLLVFWFAGWRSRPTVLQRRLWVSMLLCLTAIPIVFSHFFPDAARSVIWQATLSLIADNPWGVGVDQFKFAILPYLSNVVGIEGVRRAGVLLTNPHNDWLHVAAVAGLPVLILAVIAFLWIMVRFLRLPHVDKSIERFLLGGILILFCQSLFQFPALNAFSFFFGAVVLSFVMTGRRKSVVPVSRASAAITTRCIVAVSLCFISIVCVREFHANHVTARHLGDYQKAKDTCEQSPRFWQACLASARYEIREGRLETADVTLRRTLEHQPLNFTAWRFMAEIFRQRQQHQGFCKAIWLHNLLQGHISERHLPLGHCDSSLFPRIAEAEVLEFATTLLDNS